MNSDLRSRIFEEVNGLWVLTCGSREAWREGEQWGKLGLTVRVLRGEKMRSVPALMNEVSAAFQFPGYFGENWPALEECLSELEWLLPASGFALFVLDAGGVLADEPEGELETFMSVIATAAEAFQAPVEEGESWDRPSLPFHVVLQTETTESAAVARRWVDAGAHLRPFRKD